MSDPSREIDRRPEGVGTAGKDADRGRVFMGSGRPGEAEPLSRRALATAERVLGPDHPDVATHLNNLAVLLRDTGRPVEAEPLARRGLWILIESRRETGSEHPNHAAVLENYRGLLRSMGQAPDEIERRLHGLAESPSPGGP